MCVDCSTHITEITQNSSSMVNTKARHSPPNSIATIQVVPNTNLRTDGRTDGRTKSQPFQYTFISSSWCCTRSCAIQKVQIVRYSCPLAYSVQRHAVAVLRGQLHAPGATGRQTGRSSRPGWTLWIRERSLVRVGSRTPYHPAYSLVSLLSSW